MSYGDPNTEIITLQPAEGTSARFYAPAGHLPFDPDDEDSDEPQRFDKGHGIGGAIVEGRAEPIEGNVRIPVRDHGFVLYDPTWTTTYSEGHDLTHVTVVSAQWRMDPRGGGEGE